MGLEPIIITPEIQKVIERCNKRHDREVGLMQEVIDAQEDQIKALYDVIAAKDNLISNQEELIKHYENRINFKGLKN